MNMRPPFVNQQPMFPIRADESACQKVQLRLTGKKGIVKKKISIVQEVLRQLKKRKKWKSAYGPVRWF
jgi:hypothetical protein